MEKSQAVTAFFGALAGGNREEIIATAQAALRAISEEVVQVRKEGDLIRGCAARFGAVALSELAEAEGDVRRPSLN